MKRARLPKASWSHPNRVEIEWEDSMSTSGWSRAESHVEAGKDRRCKSVGYLVSTTKTEVIIVQSQSITGGVADSIAIPRSCIQRVTAV